jgi:hypothetical protein
MFRTITPLELVTDKYPFVFTEAYKQFLISQKKKHEIFLQDDTAVPVLLDRAGFLTTAQILFPPLGNAGRRLDADAEKVFLGSLIKFFSEKNIAHRVVQPPTYAVFQSSPAGATVCGFGTYVVDLEKHSEEELFLKIHSKHRNVIRNAEKHGLKIRTGERELPVFYALYKATMKRSGMHCEPFSYFEKMYSCMVCAVACEADRPLAAVLMPFTKFGAFYLYGASAHPSSVTGAMNFLHWEMIKRMKKIGVKRYDFVGARLGRLSEKIEGIQKFKARFGGELQKGCLWKVDIDKKQCRLFDALLRAKMAMKGKKPLPDIIDQELESMKQA